MSEKNSEENQTFWKRLMRRRVPQVLVIYLAASWTLLQFIDWIVNRYSLSPHLTDLSLVFFLSMIPSILIVTYFHGLPGKDKWHRAEKLGIPVNMLAMICLAYFLFSGKDLGSTQKKVQVSDETGKVVEKYVPKNQFRKKVALFFFENRSGSPENDWLQYATSYMLAIDFSQDLYIELMLPNVRDHFRGFNYFVYNMMRDAGFKTGVGLPLMLMKKIAGEVHRDYFVFGGIARQETDFRFDYSLYRTADMKLMARGDVVKTDLFAAIDQLSLQLRRDLEIPSGHLEKTPDLPIGEILTRSLPAARSYTEALNEMMLHQNWNRASELLEQAVKTDPAFAYANLELANLYSLSNRSAEWQALQKTLMQQSYKLPERDQNVVKLGYYSAMQEPEKAMAVLDMMIDLNPDDISLYYLRAQLEIPQNKLALALADYRKIQEIDPQRREILFQIAETYREMGELSKSEQNYREYMSAFPKDTEPLLALGNLKRDQGEHNQAKEFYQKAQLLKPDDIGIMIELGTCAFESGDFGESLTIYEKAGSTAVSAEDKFKVFEALEDYYRRRGQMKNALEYFDKKMIECRKFSIPLLVLIQEMSRADLLVLNGKPAEAFQNLSALEKQFSPPFDKALAMGYIGAYLMQEKADEAEKRLTDIQTFIKQTGAALLNVYMLKVRGTIAEIRGEYRQAIELYLEVKKQSPGKSVERSLAFCYRSLKEYDRAEELLKKALLISPFNADFNREAAQLYREMGRKEEALTHLKRAELIWREADANYEPARLVREQLQTWSKELN